MALMDLFGVFRSLGVPNPQRRLCLDLLSIAQGFWLYPLSPSGEREREREREN